MIIALGLMSGLLTTGAWLPQLLRTWRRGHADDISYLYLAVFATGVLGWLAYGLLAGQPAVVIANLVTFTLVAALVLLKTHPRRPAETHPRRPAETHLRRPAETDPRRPAETHLRRPAETDPRRPADRTPR